MSPESLLNNVYSFKSDIWAAGIVFYEMLYGRVPFYHLNEKELVKTNNSYSQNGRINFPKDHAINWNTKGLI